MTVNLSDHPTADVGASESIAAAGQAFDSLGETDIISGIENIIGAGLHHVLAGPGNGVTLTGGSDADHLALAGTNIVDLIADYHQLEGDKIDLTALYSKLTAANGALSAPEFLNEHVPYDQSSGTLSNDIDGNNANSYDHQVATANDAGSADTAAADPPSVTVAVEDHSGPSAMITSVTHVVEDHGDHSATTAIA